MNFHLFDGMFGKIEPGMCRLSMNGNIAVKTSNGYKSYNMKSGRLVNCDNFAFDIGEDFFFVIPTNKVSVGDIILVNRKPKCVKEVKKDSIVVINYEDNTIDTILPERHVFMGSQFFYGKIISLLGNNLFKKKNGINGIMKYMMMSEMFKGNNGSSSMFGSSGSGMSSILPLMMMSGGKMDGIFDGIFDFDFDDENILTGLTDNDNDEDSKESEDEE